MCSKWSCLQLFRHIPVDTQPKAIVGKTFTWRFWHFQFFFFCQGFLSRTLTTHRAIGEGRGPSLSHSITSTRSRTFRHLFSTLHVRWISYISNCTACILPPYRITIWLVDDVMLIFVCLLVDLIQGFCYSYLTLETGGPVHLLRLTFRELIHPD